MNQIKKHQSTEKALNQENETILKSCSCIRTEENDYILDAHVSQRGSSYYRYTRGSGVLIPRYYYEWDDPRKAVLLPEAEARKAEEAADRFDERLREFDRKDPVYAEIMPGVSCVWYLRENAWNFSYKVKCLKDGHMTSELLCRPLGKMVHELAFTVPFDQSKGSLSDILYAPNEKTIEKNPLYLSAMRSGDDLLVRQLKAYYCIATPEECRYVNEMTGSFILPSLPEEYDREYKVKKSSDGIYAFLRESGFHLWHRAYFAMCNHTREAVTMNPYTKESVDAAPVDGEAITLAEFLKLYEEAGFGDFINEKWLSGETPQETSRDLRGEENQ